MRTRGAPSPAELVGRSGSIFVVRDLAAAGLLDRLRLVVDPGVLGAWVPEFAFAAHRRRSWNSSSAPCPTDASPSSSISRRPGGSLPKLVANTVVASTTNNFLWFARTFWVYLETRSVVATSVVGGAYMLLFAASGIFFGTFVDRNKRKTSFVLSNASSLAFFLLGGVVFLVAPEDSIPQAERAPHMGIHHPRSGGVDRREPTSRCPIDDGDVARSRRSSRQGQRPRRHSQWRGLRPHLGLQWPRNRSTRNGSLPRPHCFDDGHRRCPPRHHPYRQRLGTVCPGRCHHRRTDEVRHRRRHPCGEAGARAIGLAVLQHVQQFSWRSVHGPHGPLRARAGFGRDVGCPPRRFEPRVHRWRCRRCPPGARLQSRAHVAPRSTWRCGASPSCSLSVRWSFPLRLGSFSTCSSSLPQRPQSRPSSNEWCRIENRAGFSVSPRRSRPPPARSRHSSSGPSPKRG